MIVSELIELLKNMPQDLAIKFEAECCQYGHHIESVKIFEYDETIVMITDAEG